MTYIKPTAQKITFTYENQVIASSSPDSGCYTVDANIHQRPETGRGDYRIQVNVQHHADHSCDAQVLYVSFNIPVVLKSCNGSPIVSSGQTIQIGFNYHNNPTDNIGLGDLVVEADSGLTITGVSMTD